MMIRWGGRAEKSDRVQKIFKTLYVDFILADFVGAADFFVGKEFPLPFEVDQLKSLSHASLSYLFRIKADWMKRVQLFRKFPDERGLADTRESRDEKVLLF